MKVSYTVIFTIIILFTSTISLAFTSSTSIYINNLWYYVVYDPRSNEGIIEVRANINLDELAYLEIPLSVFSEDTEFKFINYTSSGDLLVVGLNTTESGITVLASGTGELRVILQVTSLVEEIGVGVYSLIIDTETLYNITSSVRVEIFFIGKYNVSVNTIRVSSNTSRLDNTTHLVLDGFGLGFVILMPVVEIQQEEQPLQVHILWSVLIVAIGVLVVGGVVFYFLHRKRVVLTIEKLDYLSDSNYRAIIRVLGDSGNRGLLQADIAAKTGLPKSTVSRRVRRLEEEGLVTIKRSGKYNYVYLTDRGLEVYRKIVREGIER